MLATTDLRFVWLRDAISTILSLPLEDCDEFLTRPDISTAITSWLETNPVGSSLIIYSQMPEADEQDEYAYANEQVSGYIPCSRRCTHNSVSMSI